MKIFKAINQVLKASTSVVTTVANTVNESALLCQDVVKSGRAITSTATRTVQAPLETLADTAEYANKKAKLKSTIRLAKLEVTAKANALKAEALLSELTSALPAKKRGRPTKSKS